MTRINCVPVEDLMDQHLMAEYREIRRIGSYLEKSNKSLTARQIKNKIPKEYCLNTGHVFFHYDKAKYLSSRFDCLVLELQLRGFNIKPEGAYPIEKHALLGEEFMLDWVPTKEAIEICKERIDLRINEKPEFYRKSKYI